MLVHQLPRAPHGQPVKRKSLCPYWPFVSCSHSCFPLGGKFPLKNGLLPHHLLSLLMPLKLILMLYLCFGKWSPTSQSQITESKARLPLWTLIFGMMTYSHINKSKRGHFLRGHWVWYWASALALWCCVIDTKPLGVLWPCFMEGETETYRCELTCSV